MACRTESQNPERAEALAAYLDGQIAPALAALGFRSTIHPNPEAGAPPFLIGERLEDPALPTVLFYGHGDVVRGHEGQWARPCLTKYKCMGFWISDCRFWIGD